MKVDKSKSAYQESASARNDFNRDELRHARQLLRRLQFLEHKIATEGGLANGGGDSGGAAFAEWEAAALEWILNDIGYLAERQERQGA